MTCESNKRLVIMWRSFGHYHEARINALSKYFQTTAIQFAANQRLYNWEVGTSAGHAAKKTFYSGNWENAPQLQLCWQMIRELRELNPDILLVPWGPDLPALCAAFWGRANRKSVVVMCETALRDRRRYLIRELPKRFLCKVLFNGGLVGGVRSKRFLQSLGLSEPSIFSGYDAVDNAYFKSATDRIRAENSSFKSSPYFLFVGRMAPEKNVPLLLGAYDEYRRLGGNWDLVLVGDGPCLSKYQAIASRSSTAAHIQFAGHKPTSEIVHYYAHAKVFVLPSVREAWGLVVNEAMACSLPVIVSDACGSSDDLIVNGVTGYKFESGNGTELLQHMLHLSSMPDSERVSLGARACAKVDGLNPVRFAQAVWQLCSQLETNERT